MYKMLSGLSLDIMQGIFKIKNNFCNTPNVPLFFWRNIKTEMDYSSSLKWVQKPGTPNEMKQVTTLNEFKAKNQIVEVIKLSLPTLQNLLSTGRLHYVMSFDMINVIWLGASGSLNGNINAVVINISIKLTLGISWAIWWNNILLWLLLLFSHIAIVLYLHELV